MTIEDEVNNIRNMIFNEMAKNQAVVFDGLLDSVAVNKIPESVFVRYFLPCFVGDVTGNPNWVMEWISIAGTPMHEVDVYKDGTNEILYRVPSILNTNSINATSSTVGLDSVFARYEQIKNNFPTKSTGFIVDALSHKETELLGNNDIARSSKLWFNILSRYNMIKTTTPNIPDQEYTDYFDI